jgi:hypothetical protein
VTSEINNKGSYGFLLAFFVWICALPARVGVRVRVSLGRRGLLQKIKQVQMGKIPYRKTETLTLAADIAKESTSEVRRVEVSNHSEIL